MGNFLSGELDLIYTDLCDFEHQLTGDATRDGATDFRELLRRCDATQAEIDDYRQLVWEATCRLTARLDNCTGLLARGVDMPRLTRYANTVNRLFRLETLLPVMCQRRLSQAVNSAKVAIGQYCSHNMVIDRSAFSFHKPDKLCTVCDHVIPG